MPTDTPPTETERQDGNPELTAAIIGAVGTVVATVFGAIIAHHLLSGGQGGTDD